MPRPQKIQWPLDFNGMLNFCFKKKRPEDRLRFFKLFLRDFTYPNSTRELTPEEVEKALETAKKNVFGENYCHHIQMWSEGSFEKWKVESHKAKAQKMAIASWSDSARNKRKQKFQKKN
jgi:hypothetical protein